MNWDAVSSIILWVGVGWLFTIWFVNHFLDDRKFADAHEEVGPGMMLLLNLVGPAMLVVMLVFWLCDFVAGNCGNIIRRFYYVPPR